MENQILMPLATALWLKLNTKLSVEQIADFCNLSTLGVIALHEKSIIPYNPTIITLDLAEIQRCEQDPSAKLHAKYYKVQNKGRKYVSKFEKQKLPGLIAWFMSGDIKFDKKKLAKLFSTTAKHIEKIQQNLSADNQLHPVKSGLLSDQEFEGILVK
jgi:hypothetical protein